MLFFLGSYFNANQGMDILVTEIQTNLHMWAFCNQIQQYSPLFYNICNVANVHKNG